MQKQKEPAKRKSIPAFALLGAIGFGIVAIGGVIWGVISGAGSDDAGQVFAFIALMGAMGGASLGLALQGWREAGVLALAGAIGFTVGIFTWFPIVLGIWGFDGTPAFFAPLFLGAILGGVGGASLGLALRSWKTAGFLALAGAIGFGVGLQAASGIAIEIVGVTQVAISGAVGGATLGAALGYLEKRKVKSNINTKE